MRVKDLQQIATIDQEITALQQQLITLYEARVQLLEPTPTSHPDDIEAKEAYETLLRAWERYGITIPEFTVLKSGLITALKIVAHWDALQPELAGGLRIVVVPPVALTGIPLRPDLREKQRLLQGYDIIADDIQLPKGSKKWRMLVVYARDAGVMVEKKKIQAYQYNGKPATALGMQEYIALTLQLSQPIDTTTWTSFTVSKKRSSEDVMIYAGCRRGRYRFGINDMYGALEDDRFRPAVEIKL